jgi:hypothetical protein
VSSSAVLLLPIAHPILPQRERWLLPTCAIFAKQKARNVEHEIRRRLTKRTKEQNMEYLILVAVVSMAALYALIIIGCLKHPEW